jgi:hypothetical protein
MALRLVGSLEEMRTIIRDSFVPRDYEPHQDKAWVEAFDRFRTVLGA